jgi:hypothetical protein
VGVTDIPAAIAAELTRLRAENARLLRLLELTPQQAAPPGPAQAAYFEAPPGMVHDGSPPDAKVAFYAALFAARRDVYATRFDNSRTGKGGWVPAVRGGWRKGMRPRLTLPGWPGAGGAARTAAPPVRAPVLRIWRRDIFIGVTPFLGLAVS